MGKQRKNEKKCVKKQLSRAAKIKSDGRLAIQAIQVVYKEPVKTDVKREYRKTNKPQNKLNNELVYL